MATRHLSQIELAARWNISHRTLERWRWTGEGPKFIKLGGRVIYRLCAHHAACHDGGGAAVTCRSCLHATPVDGGWHCTRHDRMLAPAEQRAACRRHLFIPDLIPGEVIDAGDDVVTYRMADGSTWTNDARSPEAAPC